MGVGVGLLVLFLALLPALTIKERVKSFVRTQERTSVFKSINYTVRCRPFLFLTENRTE